MRMCSLHSVLWLGCLIIPSTMTWAQIDSTRVGTCVLGQAEAFLDANNVRARLLNNGNLFWADDPSVYEVPKGSDLHAVFNAGLWVGGFVRDELRMAAARYRNYQFWPGPLDEAGRPPKDCTVYDQFYEITRADLLAFNEDGITTNNLRNWPWELGAPVLDGDGDDTNYNLDGGDRPALLGDHMFWWVMNDAGNAHEAPASDSQPLGLEVHGMAYAFTSPTNDPLYNTTFYRYRLIYKGADPLNFAQIGIFADPDVGNFTDDYIGSDPDLHLGYTYNADDNDEGGYGTAPPAVGFTFLQGPVTDTDGLDNDRNGLVDEPGENVLLSAFSYFHRGGNGVTDGPQTAMEYYYYMQARWRDGLPFTFGGTGRDFTPFRARFAFPGDPVSGEFWSEVNMNNLGLPNDPSDRRFVMASGPVFMQPGDAKELTFAIVWSRGEDHLDSVRQLKADVRSLRSRADSLLRPAKLPLPDGLDHPDRVLGFLQNFPNPFSSTTTIRYSLLKDTHVRLTIYDALGREVATLVDATQQPEIYAVDFDASTLPAGVYLARLQTERFSFTQTLVVAR